MPRIARIVIPGSHHHVTQRGNNRQDIFFCDEDYQAYLSILCEQSEKFGLSVDGYCLMTNHVHLIATPAKEASLAKAVGRTHFLYTQYVNRLHGRSGHLWQNRFYSCVLDDAHFWTAMAYIEQNPVRAKMVRRPWRYAWSSAVAHCNVEDELGLLDMDKWSKLIGRNDWSESLTERLDTDELDRLRLHLSRGRPLGSDKFISKMEAKLGMRLRPLPVGRPKKNKKKE